MERELQENGFVVIPNILPEDDYNRFETLFWDDMSKVIPDLNKDDKTTWNFPRGVKGIIRSYGISQSDACWFIRTRPNIKAQWEKLYKTSELCVSMDSIIFKPKKSKIDPWFHRDQDPDQERPSYQGIYYHFASGGKDAGTILVPKSHTYSDVWETTPHSENFLHVPDELQKEMLSKAVKPVIPKNSLLIFNSRTIHASTGGKTYNTRLTMCVCYAPKEWRNEETLKKKKTAYAKGQSCAHWPDDNFRILKAGQFEHRQGLSRLITSPLTPERLALL